MAGSFLEQISSYLSTVHDCSNALVQTTEVVAVVADAPGGQSSGRRALDCAVQIQSAPPSLQENSVIPTRTEPSSSQSRRNYA